MHAINADRNTARKSSKVRGESTSSDEWNRHGITKLT